VPSRRAYCSPRHDTTRRGDRSNVGAPGSRPPESDKRRQPDTVSARIHARAQGRCRPGLRSATCLSPGAGLVCPYSVAEGWPGRRKRTRLRSCDQLRPRDPTRGKGIAPVPVDSSHQSARPIIGQPDYVGDRQRRRPVGVPRVSRTPEASSNTRQTKPLAAPTRSHERRAIRSSARCLPDSRAERCLLLRIVTRGDPDARRGWAP